MTPATPWATLFDALRDAAFVVDRDGAVAFMNAAGCRITGTSSLDAAGKPFDRLSPLFAPLREHLHRLRARPAQETLELESEGRCYHLDIDPLPGDMLLLVLADVSERRRMVQALKSQNDELADLGRRKDQFLAMLAHELRNPLGALATALHVLERRSAPNDGGSRMREICRRQVENLTRMVDDLLDVSRITRGKISLRREPVDLVVVVAEVLQVLRPTFDARGHELSFVPPAAPIPARIDRARIEQVLTNLLSNAAKFTPPGGRIAVELALQGDDAMIRVADNGMGIRPENLGRVFDLFVQVAGTSEKGATGSGLGVGLTLVRSLVEMHGGSVTAKSEGSGRGSEFLVRLPLQPAEEKGEHLAPCRSRVLLVDDDPDVREAMRSLLEDWGHSVSCAGDAAEAVQLAASAPHDIALVDIVLPGRDGYSLAGDLRAAGPRMLLAALTGNGRAEDRARALAAGFDLHLVKPIDPRALAILLERETASRRTG